VRPGMEMKNLIALTLALVAALLLAGCGGGGGPPAAPANVAVSPHDSSATVSWTVEPGIEYWVWTAPGSTITPQSCAATAACIIHRGVTASPYLVLGLTNGATYSLTITGHSSGSPGSPASAPVTFVPNLTGKNWTVQPPFAANTLRGIAGTGISGIASSTVVAVGAGGGLYSSPDGVNWTALASKVNVSLNAVLFGDARFLVAGDAGVILTSTDGVNYLATDSKTTSDLHALHLNGTTIVAVGAGGAILTSTDGLAWNPQSSPTTNALYGVTFANGLYVAVGANGTVLTSPNAITWQVVAPPTPRDLKSIAVGASKFVAVGADGTLVTSTDGATWTVQPPIAATSFNSVFLGSQFVAVGNGGAIYTSLDGITWQQAESGTTNDLFAVTFLVGYTSSSATVNIGYVAVGAGGVNLTSF
jgi:hypothetical protein